MDSELLVPEEKFSFPENFQLKLLAILSQKVDILSSFHHVIKPGYFSQKTYIWVYQIILEYYTKYAKNITYDALCNELSEAVKKNIVRNETEEKAIKTIIDSVRTSIEDEKYVIDLVGDFCRRQELKKFVLKFTEGLLEKNFAYKTKEAINKATAEFNKASMIGFDVMDNGTFYFDGVKERAADRLKGIDKPVKTGIKELDKILAGGIRPGELGVFAAGSGKGKSLALQYCARTALFNGLNVVYISTELSEKKIINRMDSMFSKIGLRELNNHYQTVVDDISILGQTLKSKYGNSLVVKYMPRKGTCVNDISIYLKRLEMQGIETNILIVDYPDEMIPSTTQIKFNSEYEALHSVYSELHGLINKLNIPCWGASQFNRNGLKDDYQDKLSGADVSSSIWKYNTSDLWVSIAMTQDQKDNNEVDLRVDKNRDGGSGTCHIKTAYNCSTFYDSIETDKMHSRAKPLVGNYSKNGKNK